MKEHTAAEGDGPINALDNALSKALKDFYPTLSKMHLSDFKVRVLDEKAGTAAKVRVLIQSQDETEYMEHNRSLRKYHRSQLAGTRGQRGI